MTLLRMDRATAAAQLRELVAFDTEGLIALRAGRKSDHTPFRAIRQADGSLIGASVRLLITD